MRLAVTYDISDNRIRTRVFRILESYGAWKQYSVFELEISDVQRLEMEAKIKSVIKPGDKVRIYELCERCVGAIVEIGEKSPTRKSNVI
ncbi:MAG: CRISPR-associated endonuclease Cas2 [Methanothrix sp.]|jgi:CRISPR-associated protein, Cas2 family|uniref:CRISPR-associated endoribonuclease Cas2 n=1 Tax=Methanothrix thermoacetophila (strain DSM 6194 / JCM 14653 / NBRC 101360 / PT) TaxID=349307 RepID=A0B9F6_METTP|nr:MULTISPECIES: CRISPR-associated endonuclease Cas2 [Methanothrix]ABK15330.1 CRISPR-associated protein, Cas2 family [Methanothrix thermoacetophila PT]MBC7080250.1 CRISPR-associated endonuclease Cas2 [Methanothrix sp.]NPU87356.1 CRISPR-associated endonuclease Cas2 [Methanothrix sp.]